MMLRSGPHAAMKESADPDLRAETSVTPCWKIYGKQAKAAQWAGLPPLLGPTMKREINGSSLNLLLRQHFPGSL